MNILRYINLLLCISFALSSCSEWDTDSLGSKFTPANSQVRRYTHIVYVEYTPEAVNVWGPYAHEVEADQAGNHLFLRSQSDSLALFVYGYPAAQDTLATTNASLKVENSVPFALYLSGLSLRSQSEPVITTTGPCHVVMPQGSRNHLWGSLSVGGHLTMGGRGSLTIESDDHCINAASLACQYEVNVSLQSHKADGIHLYAGSMRSTLGTWNITAAGNAISATDSIVLLAGTYQGTALDGSFLECGQGALVRRPTLIAASGASNVFSDNYKTAYDSVQDVWEDEMPDLTLLADTLYKVKRNSETREFMKITPRQTMRSPWVLVTNSTILSSDTLYISK